MNVLHYFCTLSQSYVYELYRNQSINQSPLYSENVVAMACVEKTCV